jgi:hypothetical protein
MLLYCAVMYCTVMYCIVRNGEWVQYEIPDPRSNRNFNLISTG